MPQHSLKVKAAILSPEFYRYFNIFSLPALLKEAKLAGIITVEQPFFGVMAFILRFFSGKKVVINAHNIEYQRFKTLKKWWWKWLKNYEGYVLKRADLVSFISEEDRKAAIHVFHLAEKKCFVSPYGIEIPQNKPTDKLDIHVAYNIPTNHRILLFFGKMDYTPNFAAFELIQSKVIPALQKLGYENFTVLICGKGLPNNALLAKDQSPIYYAGFVEDLHTIIRSSDLILNPVTSGGGVKTKVLEAIAQHKTVISTATGALGIDRSVCGEKLQVASDNDWENFAKLCMTSLDATSQTPNSFFEKYSWERIGSRYEEALLSCGIGKL